VQTINVQYNANTCSTTKQLLINVLAPTNPLCTGGGGCSVPVIAKTDVCTGSDGKIEIKSVSGGTIPYVFSIDNGVTFTTTPKIAETFPGLSAGTYSVLVKDANGCQSTVNTIVIASKVSATIGKTDVTTCSGSNGIIKFSNLQGGSVGSYTFSVDGGTTFQAGTSTPSGFTITGLAPGTYSAVVKDNVSGCISTPTLTTIALPGGCNGTGLCATVVITPKPSPAQCTLSNGKIIFSIKPFVPAINNTGVKISIQGTSTTNLSIARTNFNDSTFNALPIGTYSYSIEYGDPSCIKTGQVTIDQSGTVGTPIAANVVGPACAATATGSIVLDVPGETGNVLEWSLDGGVADPFKAFTAGNQINGIPAGAAPTFERVISVRRNSSDPCYASVRIVIQDANPVLTSTFAIAPATCNGNDGAINTIVASGGSGSGYKYSIDGVNYQTTNSFTKLPGGFYTISVKDGANCSVDFPANVTFPGYINAVIAKGDADCSNNGSSGTVTVSIADPGSYQIAISPDQFTTPADSEFKNYNNPSVTFSQLPRGQYYVYMRSTSAGTCTTRSAAIDVSGIYAVGFTPQFSCTGADIALTLTNISGDPSLPLQIRVYKKFTSALVETINVNPLPVTGNYLLTKSGHPFLRTPDDYKIELVQTNTALSCDIKSALTDITVPAPLDFFVDEIKESFGDIASGSIKVTKFTGGTTPYEIKIQLDSASTPGQQAFATPLEIVTTNSDLQFEKNYQAVPPGRYVVQVQDALGCALERIARVPLDRDIFIPNIFTPNGDESNDVFFIRNLPIGESNIKLIITSRWGKEVYNTKSYQNDWHGEGAADGIYFYRLQIGSAEPKTGWVEVLRGQKP
jgi:gliding motility-associated-like protein